MNHQVKLLQLFMAKLLLSKWNDNNITTIKQRKHLVQLIKNRKLELELLNQIDINCSIPDNIPEDAYENRFSDYSPLHVVVKMGNLDLVNELIKQGANILKQERHNQCTPLHLAIGHINYYQDTTHFRKGEHQLVSTLLSAQIQAENAVNPKCNDGMSHFHIACIFNHTEAVKFFLKSGESIDQVTDKGLTPLHWAIKFSSFDAIKILLKHGSDINLKDLNGASSLVLLTKLLIEANDLMTLGKCVPDVAYKGNIKEIQSILMLIFELKMNDPTFLDDSGLTIVHVACMLENKSILKNYLKQGFDLSRSLPKDSKFWPGWTPLHFAACCNVESIDLLLKNGADINAKNEKTETPLDLCAMRYAPRILKKILSRDEFKDITFSDGSTKLLDVLYVMNSNDKFKNLLDGLSSVDISLPNDSVIWPGMSLLHLSLLMSDKTKEYDMYSLRNKEHCNCTDYDVALYMNRINICLEKGCNVSMKNADGLSPIHLAFKLKKYMLVKELLNFCQKDVSDPNGLSHFHLACATGNHNAVQCLLSTHINVNVPTKSSFESYKIIDKYLIHHYPFSMKAQSTPLHIAVTLDDNKLVQNLVKNGADIFAKDAQGLTPLHCIMYRYNQRLAEYLLNKAMETDSSSKKDISSDGLLYIFLAAHANHSKAMKKLLVENGAQLDIVWPMDLDFFSDTVGLTPLHIAVKMRSNKVVRFLIEAGANVFAENPNRKYDSPFRRSFNNEKVFKYFVQKLKRDGMSIAALDSSGMTQLHIACHTFDLKWAKELLEMGADANAVMFQYSGEDDNKAILKITPLNFMVDQAVTVIQAVPQNFIELLQLLIDYGADVTIDYDGLTPLHLIYEKFRWEIYMKRNREAMSDYYYAYPISSTSCSDQSEDEMEVENETEDESDKEDELNQPDVVLKRTSFYKNTLKIIDLLLASQKYYNINPTTKMGFSHFHYACTRDNVDIVEKFLDNGVNINCMTSYFFDERPGYSPLHFAFAFHCGQVATLLIDSGANVNAEDAEGNTPLHIAINRKFIDLSLFDKLLGKGADVNAKNVAGITPLMCLFSRKRITLERLEFFINRGAKFDVSNSDSAIEFFDAALKHAPLKDVVSVYKMLFGAFDHTEIDTKHSFNAIASLVSAYDVTRTLDFYVDAIKQFLEMGFELEWRDQSGRTPLHLASDKYVYTAVEALLILGADINSVDQDNHPLLTRNKVYELGDEEMCSYSRRRLEETIDRLATHACKMKLVKLDLLDSVKLAVDEAVEKKKAYYFSRNDEDFIDERICQEELNKIQNTTIGQIMPLKYFLSEWGAVIDYPTMPFAHREVIDKYFMDIDSLRKEFPQFCGLLMMQYRKALHRVDLLESAKHVIVSECEIELPDLCLEAIFRYFKNDDLKILTSPDKSNTREKVATNAADQYNPEILDYDNECKRLPSISLN